MVVFHKLCSKPRSSRVSVWVLSAAVSFTGSSQKRRIFFVSSLYLVCHFRARTFPTSEFISWGNIENAVENNVKTWEPIRVPSYAECVGLSDD